MEHCSKLSENNKNTFWFHSLAAEYSENIKYLNLNKSEYD